MSLLPKRPHNPNAGRKPKAKPLVAEKKEPGCKSKNVTNNPMKDNKGVWRTDSLFFEFKHDDLPYHWTIHDRDREENGVIYPSMKLIYMAYDHIPQHEYQFAMDVLGSWDHWLRMCQSSRVGQHIAIWREELDVKIKAQAVKDIMAVAKGDSAAAANAAKWLAEKGYASKRGRPSKAEKHQLLKQEAEAEGSIEKDFQRLGLVGK